MRPCAILLARLFFFTLILLASATSASRAQQQADEKKTEEEVKPCEPVKKMLVGHTEVVKFASPVLNVHVCGTVGEGECPTGSEDVADVRQGFDAKEFESEEMRANVSRGNMQYVFVTGKRPGTIILAAFNSQAKQICGTTVNVARPVDVIKSGNVQSLLCNPDCKPEKSLEQTLSELPEGSTVTLKGGPQQ